MDVSRLIDPLNSAQRAAVCAPAGDVLVLAGAGSGKTRVLVHRIAWLIQVEGISPYGILAVTFTNKAAGEMRGRIEQLLGIPSHSMWVGTFHGIAHRLLRAHCREAGLPEGFQILDSDDQYRAVRRVMREIGLDESQWPPRQVQWYINARKDEGLRPEHLEDKGDIHLKHMIEVYRRYDALCRRSGLVDFAELLLRAHELWLQRSDVLAHYRQRFQHILVDEFQDTNGIQYAWLRLLAGQGTVEKTTLEDGPARRQHLFVVGDDDQSIYGWRGARVENIQQFPRDFPGTLTLRLEQNYRSTGNILAAANALIAHNSERLGKQLWTEGGDGEPIHLYAAFNELDEAHFVTDQIRLWVEQGGQRRECAILYRSNAQSRVFEDALIHAGMPYRVYGGLRFFERAEIKDALAYLRLLANRHDDAAFERVVNTPTRGVGERTLAAVREYARHHDVALWQAADAVIEEKSLAARAINALHGFTALIETMDADSRGLTLFDRVEHTVQVSGLIAHFGKDRSEKGRTRLENLEELTNAARQFVHDFEAATTLDSGPDVDGTASTSLDPLSEFLAHAALEAGETQGGAWEDCVQLMTLHSAKGLEFRQVFICGVEEGLFPHRRSAEEPGRLEEERRLCYVGMTRAMEKLTLAYAEVRRLHGEENYTQPSRFISELPSEHIEEVRLRGSVAQPMSSAYPGRTRTTGACGETAPDGLQLGQRVAHEKFGEGVVLGYEGQGRHARVHVNFEDAGSKWLVVEYARLTPL